MEKRFCRTIECLEDIFGFIEDYFSREKINGDSLFVVKLVIEELFTNMVKYEPGNPNQILIRLERQDELLEFSLTDYDVDPFDVTQRGEVDVTLPLEERRIGGLGIHLVKKMVDKIEYEYECDLRQSKITLVKKLK